MAIQAYQNIFINILFKNVFAKSYIPNWSGEVFVITKAKNTIPWAYAITVLNSKEIAQKLYEKELPKQIKRNLE